MSDPIQSNTSYDSHFSNLICTQTMSRTLLLSLIASLAQLLSHPALAQNYPDKPVKIIVPWSTGGSTDAIARTLAQRLSESMGQSFIVENRPGAAAAIGTGEMAKAAPDGYTLGLIELPHAIAPSVVAKLPYDLQRDLQPVAMIGTSPLMLFANADLPAKSVREFVDAAKAKPGTIAIAHGGSGSSSHLAAELLQQRTGAKFNLASYKGSGPAMLDVAGGHVSAHFATFASGGPTVKTGKVAILGVASAKRLTALKDSPTFPESGIPDFVVEQWWGMVAPKGTPAPIIEKLRTQLVAALSHESMQTRLRELAIEPRPLGPTEFAAFVDAELKRWASVVKTAGIKPE
jgi:tripartite-type tricarboxylate transporter receptor subunit TctC